MNGFPIEGSDTLKFARKGRQDFSIFEGEAEIIALPREVGRRVWLALFCESRVTMPRRPGYSTGLLDVDSLIMPFQRLQRFRSESNCHGTALELMTNSGSIATQEWAVIRNLREAENHFMHPLLSRYYGLNTLQKSKKKFGFPLFAYREAWRRIQHSIAILGEVGDRNVVFEKVDYENEPFRLFLASDYELDNYQFFAPYKKQ